MGHSYARTLVLGVDRSPGALVAGVTSTWREGRHERRRIVVTLDGEVAARAAPEYALDEAGLLGVEVVALHAVPGGTKAETESAERNVAELLAGVRAESPRHRRPGGPTPARPAARDPRCDTDCRRPRGRAAAHPRPGRVEPIRGEEGDDRRGVPDGDGAEQPLHSAHPWPDVLVAA
jgi:universal stress protein family protein